MTDSIGAGRDSIGCEEASVTGGLAAGGLRVGSMEGTRLMLQHNSNALTFGFRRQLPRMPYRLLSVAAAELQRYRVECQC